MAVSQVWNWNLDRVLFQGAAAYTQSAAAYTQGAAAYMVSAAAYMGKVRMKLTQSNWAGAGTEFGKIILP